MEHPILFLCLILEKLGIPSGPNYYEHADKYGILAKVFAPHMVYSYFVCIFIIVLALLNPMEVFRVGAIALFDPELTVMGPVAYFLLDSFGRNLLIVYSIIYPLLLGICFSMLGFWRFTKKDIL